MYPSPDYLSLSIGKAGIRTPALGLFESLGKEGVHIATVTVATFVNAGSRERKVSGRDSGNYIPSLKRHGLRK